MSGCRAASDRESGTALQPFCGTACKPRRILDNSGVIVYNIMMQYGGILRAIMIFEEGIK